MSVKVAAFLLCVCIASNVMANVDICNLKPDSGPCPFNPDYTRGVMQWYHVNGVCKEFPYGGCGGNKNNFLTREECERKCIVCNLPPKPGNCVNYKVRSYFDNGLCKTFVYGGCDGNDNRFDGLHACYCACAIESDEARNKRIRYGNGF